MLEQDPIPLESAPEASADPLPAVVAGPASATDELEREPVSAGAPRRSRRLRSIAFVVAILVFDLLVVAGVGFYLSVGAPAGVIDVPPGVEYGLRARVAASYPDFTVSAVKATTRDDTRTASGGREVGVFFEMQSVSHPGFVLSRFYTATEAQAGDAKNYENTDDFFCVEATNPQPVDSFMEMWVHQRPGQTVYFVSETGYSTDATRTYLVMAEWSERSGTKVKTVRDDYDYQYAPAADTWVTSLATLPEASAPEAFGSLPDTDAVVAQCFPGYEIASTAFEGVDTVFILQSRAYPEVQMAVLRAVMNPGNSYDELVQLGSGDRKRADAFAKAWSATRPGTVIVGITYSSEGTGRDNIAEVWFVDAIAAYDSSEAWDSVFLRYDAKKRRWTRWP